MTIDNPISSEDAQEKQTSSEAVQEDQSSSDETQEDRLSSAAIQDQTPDEEASPEMVQDQLPVEATHDTHEDQASTEVVHDTHEDQAPTEATQEDQANTDMQVPEPASTPQQTGGSATTKPDEAARTLSSSRLPRRRPRPRVWLLALLCSLVIIIVASMLFGPQFTRGRTVVPPLQPAGPVGPFAQLPLSAQQIDAIQHLPSHLQYKQLASLYVSRMSLDEEIGQLIMAEYSDTAYSSDLDMMVNTLHAGGVIMYEFQMTSFDQTKGDIAHMQQRATFPLLISTDEEGGPYVHRLNNIYPPRMSATEIGNTGDPSVATSQGVQVAHDLLSLGINVNLAPDVDVQLIAGPDQVTRTFGTTADSVITYAGAYMAAMQKAGVIATIKHFPGLGDASIDAHFGLPVVNRSKDDIYNVELQPFRHFVQLPEGDPDHPGIVMPTDVLMPAIDPTMPAELSHTFITDILRKQFGYDGVVLTDALYMQGVEINGQQISMGQAAVMALQAGDDMILGPDGTSEMVDTINAIKAALNDGTLSKARIDEAATRILTLKLERHLMPDVPPSV